MLDDEADAGGDFERGGNGCSGSESHKRVIGVPVIPWQVWSTRPRSVATGGDVRVLGEEERFEAALLARRSKLDRPDRVVERIQQLQRLAARAGLEDAEVEPLFPFRWLLTWSRR